eukprot:symbB.v1.2.040294.t1/scaffold7129.1/size13157/2
MKQQKTSPNSPGDHLFLPFQKVTRASCLLLPARGLRKPCEIVNRRVAGLKCLDSRGNRLAEEKKLASQTELKAEKYSHLAPATVAFLWQFPPSFVYSDEIFQRLERLVEYLASNQSGVQEARHIVDFRDGSWYREDVYDFLRRHRWCLAWLHLNNRTGWASNLPSGWTDRVQTTNFCFCRLFGPDGQTHGSYDNKFLHELFDSFMWPPLTGPLVTVTVVGICRGAMENFERVQQGAGASLTAAAVGS